MAEEESSHVDPEAPPAPDASQEAQPADNPPQPNGEGADLACSDAHLDDRPSRSYAKAGCVVLPVAAVTALVLVPWFIVHPKEPSFRLLDASVYAFQHYRRPDRLATDVVVTLASYNRNRVVGFLYDELRVWASYRGLAITGSGTIPPTPQRHGNVGVVWSPRLVGANVTVDPGLATAMDEDRRGARRMPLDVKVEGRLRWTVGMWKSWRFDVSVSCPAQLSFDDADNGSGGAGDGAMPPTPPSGGPGVAFPPPTPVPEPHIGDALPPLPTWRREFVRLQQTSTCSVSV